MALEDLETWGHRICRSSDSYVKGGVTSTFGARDAEPADIQRITTEQSTDKVTFTLGDDQYEIEPVIPKGFRARWRWCRGETTPEVKVTCHALPEPDDKFPTRRLAIRPEIDFLPPTLGQSYAYRMDAKEVALRGAKSNRLLEQKDPALLALKAPRTTSDKAFLKQVKRAQKIDNVLTVRLPNGYKIGDRRKEFEDLCRKLMIHGYVVDKLSKPEPRPVYKDDPDDLV